MSDDPTTTPITDAPVTRRRRRRRKGGRERDAQHPWIPRARIIAITVTLLMIALVIAKMWRYDDYVKSRKHETRQEEETKRLATISGQAEKQNGDTFLPVDGGKSSRAADAPPSVPAPTPAVTPAATVATTPPAPVLDPLKEDPAAITEPSSSKKLQGVLGSIVPQETLPLQPDAPEARQAISLLEAFRAAPTWRDKAAYVRDLDRCKPLMKVFYEDLKQSDPVVTAPMMAFRAVGSSQPVVQLHQQRDGSQQRAAPPAIATFIRQPSGEWKLDWESWVGHSEMPWSDFRAKRTITPTLFRVFVEEGNYYNYEFTDEKRYLSIVLRSPDGEQRLNGYCERDSRVGEAMRMLTGSLAPGDRENPARLPALYQRGSQTPVTLQLAFPPAAQSDNCVIITDLITGSWLVTDMEK
jgi:hypothetical protein